MEHALEEINNRPTEAEEQISELKDRILKNDNRLKRPPGEY